MRILLFFMYIPFQHFLLQVFYLFLRRFIFGKLFRNIQMVCIQAVHNCQSLTAFAEPDDFILFRISWGLLFFKHLFSYGYLQSESHLWKLKLVVELRTQKNLFVF